MLGCIDVAISCLWIETVDVDSNPKNGILRIFSEKTYIFPVSSINTQDNHIWLLR